MNLKTYNHYIITHEINLGFQCILRLKLLEYHIHYIPSGDSDRPVIVSLWPVSSWTGLWFGPIVFFDPSLFVFLRSHTLTTLSIPPLIIWSLLSPNVTEVTWYVEVRLNTAPLNNMWIRSIFFSISESLTLYGETKLTFIEVFTLI